MKHISTTHSDESDAKSKYAVADCSEPAIADEKVEEAARRLYEMMKKADEDELEMSRLRGILMSAMKSSQYLKNKDGVLLCSWVSGNASSKTDWKGLCKKHGINDSDVAEFTKKSIGARRFSIEIGE